MDVIAQKIKEGDRRAIAQALTLVESKDEKAVEKTIALLPLLKNDKLSLRVLITGAPGVGKSSFIKAFGQEIIKQGKKIAVLAIDPSSPLTGGSILADKTRMDSLVYSPHAFIRPMPSAGYLGGIHKALFAILYILEAAGFDYIVVETVGVGQSDSDAFDFCDVSFLLVSPATGDSLQALKRGIIELADSLIITKDDGDLKKEAQKTFREFNPVKKAFLVSSKEEKGFKEVYNFLETIVLAPDFPLKILSKRKEKLLKIADYFLKNDLINYLTTSPVFQKIMDDYKKDVLHDHLKLPFFSQLMCKRLLKA
ncbi:MAG: methylmalonyl Co-A mutase-associated GTPase MeaB [Proteobacteria bacterium]|nr:methylmalonyl Co-A mutase-associated GTPase MeaB [Pseudomonadota bacterium]